MEPGAGRLGVGQVYAGSALVDVDLVDVEVEREGVLDLGLGPGVVEDLLGDSPMARPSMRAAVVSCPASWPSA